LLADAQEKQGNCRDAFDNYLQVLKQAPEHRPAREGLERLRSTR
jgi:hypothetical protein